MSLRSLESAILKELRTVVGKKKIRLKDIAEHLAYLPVLGIHVSYMVQS
jgi:hypothetical protein